MRFLGAVARQFSIGTMCYTRTAINYGYFIAFTLEESSGALSTLGLGLKQLSPASASNDSSSLTNEKDHRYFLNSADVCW